MTKKQAADTNIRDTFLYQHMVESLKHEPRWTVQMYLVFNDLDGTPTGIEMKRAYEEDQKR